MVELTDDVILAILDHIKSRAMLHTLLLVSRWFRTAVEPRLYSSIEFNASGPITLRHRFEGLRRRIVSNQYLASSVRKLHVTVGNTSEFTPEEFSHLDDMLRYLDGLKDFKLRLYTPPGGILAALIKAPCPFALTKFSWVHGTLDAGEILRYLENQPSIEHLHVATLAIIGTINLVPGTLPRLKELVVPTPMAIAILPGRKVTCLEINLHSPFPDQSSLAMEEALGHIEFLSCTTRKTAFILPGICSMRKLRWLHLSFPLGIQQTNLIKDMQDLLQSITDRATNLTYFQISACSFRGSMKDLVTPILKSVPPSCLVDIQRRQAGVFDRYYAGKHISLVFENCSPTSAAWWWNEDKLQRVLTESRALLAASSEVTNMRHFLWEFK